MIQAINFNFNKRSTLQNKGVCDTIALSNSLMDESKKVEKKLAKYLVVSNILQQKDRYLSKNRYLCNINKRNYKNRTFQGIIIKATIYESNRSRREIKTAFSK